MAASPDRGCHCTPRSSLPSHSKRARAPGRKLFRGPAKSSPPRTAAETPSAREKVSAMIFCVNDNNGELGPEQTGDGLESSNAAAVTASPHRPAAHTIIIHQPPSSLQRLLRHSPPLFAQVGIPTHARRKSTAVGSRDMGGKERVEQYSQYMLCREGTVCSSCNHSTHSTHSTDSTAILSTRSRRPLPLSSPPLLRI
jgi:hypothetical protein